MARRKARAEAQTPPRLILDSGAILALAHGDQRARAFMARALQFGADVSVPAVVVAETVRGSGPRDAPVNRVLSAIDSVLDTDEAVARIAGELLGDASSDETIDAIVVAATLHRGGGRILTSDPDDLRELTGSRPGVVVHRI